MRKIYSHTLGLCPVCKKKVHSRIIEKDNKIYLEKYCERHGITYALICSDISWYRDSIQYVKPRQLSLDVEIKDYKGCPDSCGLCIEHQQHTCLPVIEITSKCNLCCPICLKSFKNSYYMTIPQFESTIDKLFKYEGRVDVINLSGGEPTIHPDFRKFLKVALEKNVIQTTVSTNGIKILKDKNIRDTFKKTGAIVALQFDGFLKSTYKYLRGQDLSLQKLKLIELLEKENIRYSLVATIAKSINDKEVTKTVDYFFKSKALSLMFQPITFTGKAQKLDVNRLRITIPEIVNEIEKSKYVKKGDFNPLPCSHFSCFALSYYIMIDKNNFLSLKEFLGKENYLKIIANKTLPGLDHEGYSMIKERIYEVWSAEDYSMLNKKVIDRIRKVLKEMSLKDFSTKRALSLGVESMKAIFIHSFMDVHTMDFGRLIKCCNPYLQRDGRFIPMCAQNVLL